MLGPGLFFAGGPLALTLSIAALVQGRERGAAMVSLLLSAGSLAFVAWLIVGA